MWISCFIKGKYPVFRSGLFYKRPEMNFAVNRKTFYLERISGNFVGKAECKFFDSMAED